MNKILSKIDFFLLLCVLLLTCTGILFIYSSGFNSDGVLVTNEYIKQIIWASIGLVCMMTVTFLDYRRFYRYSPYFYIAILLLLVYTRLFGRYVNGAKSWIGIGSLGIQPSEISKIFYLMFFARYLEQSQKEEPLKRFLVSLLILAGPSGLILTQPDLGTASVFIPIFLFMCYMAAFPIRYLVMILATGLLAIIFTVLPIWESEIAKISVPLIGVLTNTKLLLVVIGTSFLITFVSILGFVFFRKKYYYWIAFVFGIFTVSLIGSILAGKVLKPYQIQRLIIFLDPNSDPRGSGWNIIQSKIAIGSGNLWGRGFKMGTQSHYRFLPQQSTDFIFSIFSEETGFVGGLLLFAAFLGIFLRTIAIIRNTTNMYGYFICSGILGMFFFHFVENVGMVMGCMPITGIPLPFMSYGGSALVTNMIAIGLLMSVNARRLNFDVRM